MTSSRTVKPASLRPGHVLLATESAASFWGIPVGTPVAEVVGRPFREQGLVIVAVKALGTMTGPQARYAAPAGSVHESSFVPNRPVTIGA